MSVHIQADTGVVNDLLARFPFTSYNSIVQARVELAQQIRLSMKYPQAYQTPITQRMPADQPLQNIATYVHPWNVACALLNVCVNGMRFGGDNLAPQEDLQVFVGEWKPLGDCTFPSAVVPLQEKPAGAMTPPTAPLPPAPPEAAAQAAAQAAAAPADTGEARPLPGTPGDGAAPQQGDGPACPLPDSSIAAERTGQSGRPQKSPFEKKIEARSKIAAPPFWWVHMLVSAPWIFTRAPAAAVDDSSTGAGPVQSYMVLLGLLQRVLSKVDDGITVGQLRAFLLDIDRQVAERETNKAANQLRQALIPKK